MGTQAVVSIVRDGATVVKIVTGCDGFNAQEVAGELCIAKTLQLNTIYGIAGGAMGCKDCLVVMDANSIIYNGEDELSDRYRETFNDPLFNPRWDCGLSAYSFYVDADTWQIVDELEEVSD